MNFRCNASGCGSLILGVSLLALSGLAQAVPTPIPLPNPNPTAYDNYYGTAVALTPDGSIAAVGADADGDAVNTPPSVSIYQYSKGAWSATPIITICDPSSPGGNCNDESNPADLFGSAVSVSSISNSTFFLVVGSPGGDGVVTYGVVYVFQCTLVSPASCTQSAQINDPAPSPSVSDNFGSAVAITQDGSTILIGAWGTPEPGGPDLSGNQPDEGAAYLYYLGNTGSWILSSQLLDPAPTCMEYTDQYQTVCDEFGYAVALSGSKGGTIEFVGAPGAVESNSGSPEPGEGQAFIFNNGGTLITTFTDPNTVSCSGVVPLRCDEYGTAVALSADGSTALVGAPNAFVTGSAGSVLGEYGLASLYQQSTPGTWAGVTSPIITYSNPNQNPNDDYTGTGGFGFALALSNDGSTQLVGVPEATEGVNSDGYGGTGEMDSYTCNFSSSPACVNTPVLTFIDPIALAYPDESPEPADFFGAAVAISGDASVFLAGAPHTNAYDANSNGAAYVYGGAGVYPPVALGLSYSGPNNVSVVPGQDLIYDLTVTNTSSTQAAVNVVLTGTLAAGVTLVSYSADGATCIGGNGNYTCVLASLAPGATWTPAVTLEVSSADVGQTVAVAVVSVKAQNSSNNPAISASVTVTASTASGNLLLTYGNLAGICTGFGATCPNANPGDSFLYIISVTNTGSTTANNVLVTVTIPPGMTFTNPSASPGICLIDVAEAKMACALDTLAPSTNSSPTNWVIKFTATVNNTDTYGQILTSQAMATSSNGSAPTQTYTVTVGTPIGTSGAIGWLEILMLGGLCWLGRRRMAKTSA